jgi:hypothetical protein
VDKSPRRVPGTAALSSCHEIKLRVAVILAGSAVVYINVAPANLWPGDLVGKLSGSDCNHSNHSDADGHWFVRRVPRASISSSSSIRQQLSQTHLGRELLINKRSQNSY